MTSSTNTSYKNGAYQSTASTATSYGWYDAAVQSQVDYSPGTGGTYHTYYTNSATGVLQSASVQDGRPRSISLTNDALGQALRRDEADNTASTGDPHELWYRFNGKQIGYIGNNDTDNIGYAASLQRRVTASVAGPFKNGQTYGAGIVEFDQAYDAINSYQQGAGGGSYTVRDGDSLSGIAAQLWGDAGLWYKLAQANGLAGDSGLVAGQTLSVPSGVVRSSNNAGTFRPYDVTQAYGDSSPTTPSPTAAKKNKCGAFGAILLVAIAVAVTIWASPAAPSVWQGALAGLAGSAASQAVGLATGIQDTFDWKGVALAGIGAGIGGVLGSVMPGGGAIGAIERGVLGSAVTQGIGVATGLQSKFDWAGVAAAGIGAGAGQALGGKLDGLGPVAASLAANTVGGLANAATRSLVNGTDFGDNLIAALPDIIGQTVGSWAAGEIQGGGKQSRGEKAFLANAEKSANEVPATLANSIYEATQTAQAANDAGSIQNALYIAGSNKPRFLFTSGEEVRDPRLRMGGNGGPPLEDWRILRQLGQPLPTGPSGALFGVLDNLLDITGPAVELQSDLLDLSARKYRGEIRSIDPDHRWPDRLIPSWPESQSLRSKLDNANFYRSELAATKYIYQGDIGALQNETLRVYQGFVDLGYEQALNEFRAGNLKPAPGWSAEQAIGSRMDQLARLRMRTFYAEHRINPGLDINVTVNNRLPTQPEGSYRIPDVRVGGVIFDASISAKQSSTAQIRGFYSSPTIKTVIIVRPTTMTNGGAYALPKK